LVLGELSGWVLLIRILGPLLAVAGVVVLMASEEGQVIGNVMFWGGAIFSAVTEVTVFILQKQRVWVLDNGTGFTLYEPTGEATIADTDVVAISLWDKSIYSNGEYKGMLRNVRLWVRNRDEPVQMTYRITTKSPEQVTELLQRHLDRLLEEGSERLARGEEVQGEGWALKQGGLKVDNATLVPIEQIAALDILKDEVCIWRINEEVAAIRFPIASRNSHLLVHLLSKQLPENRDESLIGGEGLGRVMFEKPLGLKTKGWIILLVISVVMFPVIGFFSLLGAVAASAGLAGLSTLFWWLDRERCFRVCYNGTFLHGRLGEKQLRYDELESFTYSVTRNYYNGAYTGTTLNLVFVPLPTVDGTKITFNHTFKNEDTDFDNLRDHVSGIMAVRMGKELEETGRVPWTKDVAFCTEGLEYRPSGWLGKKQETLLLPWGQIANFNFQDGVFHIWEVGKDKSVIHEMTSAANLFPGFLLLIGLIQPDSEEGAAEDPLRDLVQAEEGPGDHRIPV
ncbi:MAG: hypothetical protein WD045_02865, partial [Pirellulaceae bacterium]